MKLLVLFIIISFLAAVLYCGDFEFVSVHEKDCDVVDSNVFLQNVTSQQDNVLMKFLDQEDTDSAAAALIRLQETYNLQISEIVEGRLAGVQRTTPFKARDCFEVGRIAYNQGEYYHAYMWMQESLGRVRREYPPTASENEILEHLSLILNHQEDSRRALDMTKSLHEIDPDHPRAKGDVKSQQDSLIERGDNDDNEGMIPLVNTKQEEDEVLEELDLYHALCRGQVQPTEAQRAKLTCYYKANIPYLKLAPIKAELLHLRPKIVLFRQVISDEEIEVVKELAEPKLARSKIHNPKNGNLETASYRTSKSAWLKDADHPVVARLTRRANLISDLEMSTAEDLQVAHYGLGGHYDPHYDFAGRNESVFQSLNTGNRIATILFYLSTPEAGGATVFPELKLTLHPSKNDAVFWHNLHRSGEGDGTTLHAACPVLSGTKWVSNRWIHERGQEFRRPCALDPLEYE